MMNVYDMGDNHTNIRNMPMFLLAFQVWYSDKQNNTIHTLLSVFLYYR